MVLAIDASTPASATNTVGTTATVTTGSFTPPAGSLLLNLWSGNTETAINPGAPAITDNLGVHLTYALQDWQSRADSPNKEGQVADWSAVVGSSAAQTVTVTSGTTSGNQQSALQVVVLTGQHLTSPIGAHGKSGSASASTIAQNFTGTAAGSMGFIVVCDWDALGSMTAGTGCTLIATGTIPTTQISWGMFRRTTADGTVGGTTTLNVNLAGTSTHVNWAYVEVVPVPVSDSGQQSTARHPGPGPRITASFRLLGLGDTTASVSAPDQTVLPSGITTSEALGSPTISLAVSASGIPTSEAFGSPAISLTVNASGITTSEAFGKPTISLSVTPSGITTSEALGSPTVSLGVSASGIISSEALGSPTITTTVTVTPSGIPSSEAFGNANIATATVIVASGIASAEAFGSPSISRTVSPSGIPTSEAFGKPTISLTVTASGITSAEALGSPTIQVITAINASGIPSSEAFGSPTITTTATVNASGIPSSERLGSPSIATVATVQASGISSSEAFGKPTITTGSVTIQASGIPSAEAFGRAQVSLGALSLVVQASGIPSAESFGAPFVGVEVQIDITATVKVDVIVWRADPNLEAPVVVPGIVSRADDVIIAPVGPDVI